ncbi:BASS2 [Symbiodinium pilosum]|uniref:BASS2 protein n=1 Tax=Symbiodinium pilosum TaxID=2952 RepID=A0A812WQ98_SYMPI|nr:BASS2 [Symbiodinium pilosum]
MQSGAPLLLHQPVSGLHSLDRSFSQSDWLRRPVQQRRSDRVWRTPAAHWSHWRLSASLLALGSFKYPRVFRPNFRAARRATAEKAFEVAEQFVSRFNDYFVLWLAVVTLVSVARPATFTWVNQEWFTWLLGLLMFSVGLTTSVDDFRTSIRNWLAVVINAAACFLLMPALAYSLAILIRADPPILAGMVLIGSINGGHTSNLCTLIAKGDVALSVLMTMSTTLLCIVATPLLAKLLLGTVVSVDAVGIILSTVKVVLAPTIFGLAFKQWLPETSDRAARLTPVLGVLATCVIVGSSVASCRSYILSAGAPLQLAILGLHLLGGFFAELRLQSNSSCVNAL